MSTEQLWDTALPTEDATFSMTPAGASTFDVRMVGRPLLGQPTTVFGILGFPRAETGLYPAVLLAHGGLGRADDNWVRRWTDRGHVALALDLDGAGPKGILLADGMPRMDNLFDYGAPNDSWTYHGVSALLGRVSVLSSLPEVDPAAFSLMGISMGGILTCIAASLDARLNFAVSIYGSCGFADTQ